MPIEIRETIVTPDASADVVQLRISDVPLDDESGSLQLTILAKLRPLKTPTLAHLQRAAMQNAQDALTHLLRFLAKELQESGYGIEPPPKTPLSG
jgi:hypothetical protein